MTNFNPSAMLKLYRQSHEATIGKQVEMFNAMPAPDKMELLFYMNLHSAMVVQNIRAQINPQHVATTPIDEINKVN